MRSLQVLASLCLHLALAGCVSSSANVSKQEVLEAYSDTQTHLTCTPGCELVTNNGAPNIPIWCSKWLLDTETQKYLCVEIELNNLSQAKEPYAPILVWPTRPEATYRVDCRPGCSLPTSIFGCKHPAKKAPYLETCANVENACGTGQSQIWFSGPIPSTPKNETPPACVAFKSKQGRAED